MKNYRLKNLFGCKTHKNEKVVVTADEPHIQSLGALIKLKHFYQSIDPTHRQDDLSFKVWLRFRNRWLKNQKRIHKTLTCYFCGETNLNPNYHSPRLTSSKQKATIDHFIPVSKGGGKFDEKNLVVACGHCNGKKADLMPERFQTEKKAA